MRRTAFSVALVGLALTASCIRFHGPEDLRRDLSQAAGVQLDREMGVTLTRTGVMLARWFTSEEDVPLKGVRRVEVGVYEVTGLRRGVDERLPVTLPELPGWQLVVRIRESDEEIFVLVHEKKEKLRGILVIVAEDDEWVLVRIRGKIEHMMDDVMEMAFSQAERPDLYEPAMAEYRETQSGQGIPIEASD